jgi:hypothetical protein
LAPRLLTSAWLTRRAPRCAGDTPLYRRTQRRGLRPSAARAPVLLAAHARAVLYAALKWCASPVANHSATHSAAAFQQLLHRCSALGPMLVSLSQLELHTAGDRRALGGARYETEGWHRDHLFVREKSVACRKQEGEIWVYIYI